MADEIKPPISGSTAPSSPLPPSGTTPPKPLLKVSESTASPLTPDIKIPPNLPTSEIKPSTTPPPTRPVIPSPPLPPRSSIPSNPPKSTFPAPSPAIQPSQPPHVFKSSIRTMQEDVSNLKKGQAPSGFKVEKESEKEIKPIPETGLPKITLPPPVSHVELGKTEKAKPLPSTIPPPLAPKTVQPTIPSASLAKPSLSVPPTGLRSKKIFFIVIGLLVVAATVAEFLILSISTPPISTSTPTPTFFPTPTPISIESFFSPSDSISITFRGDPSISLLGQFLASDKLNNLISSGGPGIYKTKSQDGTKQYGFAEFMDGMLVEIPPELESLIDDSSFLLTFMPKSDGHISYGFIVRLNSQIAAETYTVMKNWENTMKSSLAKLLQFNQNEASTTAFQDNIYNGISIRFLNFPDPDLTIDYSIINAQNGESYLVLVNSKEQIYSIIDKIK